MELYNGVKNELIGKAEKRIWDEAKCIHTTRMKNTRNDCSFDLGDILEFWWEDDFNGGMSATYSPEREDFGEYNVRVYVEKVYDYVGYATLDGIIDYINGNADFYDVVELS